MDLSRAVYSRDLKITAMRALDAGASTGEIARKYQLSPKLLSAGAENGAPEAKRHFPVSDAAETVCRRSMMPAASPIWSAKLAR
jgi:transposase-like protein